MTIFLIFFAVWLPLAALIVAFIHGATRKPTPTRSDGAAEPGPAA